MNAPETTERPGAITFVCVLMALGAVAIIPALLAAPAGLPGWYTPFVLASAAVGLVCMVGLWTMKKWAAFTYMGMTAVAQAGLLVGGLWTPMAIIGPAIVITIMFVYLDKMR